MASLFAALSSLSSPTTFVASASSRSDQQPIIGAPTVGAVSVLELNDYSGIKPTNYMMGR